MMLRCARLARRAPPGGAGAPRVWPRAFSALAHELIATPAPAVDAASDDSAPTVVLLHGILGSKQNLRSFSRKISGAFPGTRCVLVDLPAHGDSPGTSPPGQPLTVQDCADDVARLLREDLGVRPDVICGHSFGGKVALTLLRNEAVRPKACWVLDSQPGLVRIKGKSAAARRNPNSVESIIDTIADELRPPFVSKEEMMAQMEAAGIEIGVRHWMTTNVVRNAEGTLDWKFDIDTVRHLFVDYCGRDMWSSLGSDAIPECEVHLVRATRNSFWDREDTQNHLEEQQAANPARLFVHDVDAGHWLHSEKPNELFDVMVGRGRLGESLGQ